MEKFWGMKNLLKKIAFAALLMIFKALFQQNEHILPRIAPKALGGRTWILRLSFREMVDDFAYNRSSSALPDGPQQRMKLNLEKRGEKENFFFISLSLTLLFVYI